MPMNGAERKAFSLAELLVVIAIISVLAALLLPALERNMVEAMRLGCASNLRQMGVGASIYLDEARGWCPQQTITFAGNSCPAARFNKMVLLGYWPDGVRECPSLPLEQAERDAARGEVTSLTASVASFGVPTSRDPGASRILARGITARWNPFENYFAAYNTLPIISDSTYFYYPNGGYAYIAHTDGGTGNRKGQIPYAPSAGQNSVWLDGHVQWNAMPEWTSNGDCTRYWPQDMYLFATFSGWTRLYSTYAVSWCEKRRE